MDVEAGRRGMAEVRDTGVMSTGVYGDTGNFLRLGKQFMQKRSSPASSRGAVLLGDDLQAVYHPLEAVRHLLETALTEDFDLEITEDYEILSTEQPPGRGLIVAYTDRWQNPVSSEQARGIVQFVKQGGGLVLIHSGISLAANSELETLIGARFIDHPPYQTLSFEPVVGKGGAHPIVQNIESFDSPDEPYRYSLSRSHDREVILEYWLDGRCYPAAWVQKSGLGRIAVLMPGHNSASLESSQVQRLIRSSCLWAAGRI